MKTYKTHYEALQDGREIVIISNDPLADSAIFYATRTGNIYSFNRSNGVMARPDMTPERLEKHITKMHNEGAEIYLRGTR